MLWAKFLDDSARTPVTRTGPRSAALICRIMARKMDYYNSKRPYKSKSIFSELKCVVEDLVKETSAESDATGKTMMHNTVYPSKSFRV